MSRCFTALAGVALVVGCFLPPAIAGVQPGTDVSSNAEAAQGLAKHALECLRRGEDLLTTTSRLAAYREGLELAQRAVAADDLNAAAHFALFANQGRIMLLEGGANPLNLLAVNRELDRVLQLNPNYADAWAAKGGLYRQLPWLLGGSLRKAEECLTRAIALDPSNAVTARIELAATYRDMGEPERGVPLLETAIQVAERAGKLRQLAEARALLREVVPHP